MSVVELRVMKIPKLSRYDVIEVTLQDLTYTPSWSCVTDVMADEASIMKLVGYYLNHDKFQLRVCSLFIPREGKVSEAHFIPMGSIVTVRRFQ